MYTFPGEILGGSVAALEFVNKAAKAVGRTFTFGLSWGCCACWRLKGWVTNWTFGPGLTGPVDMVMAVAGLTAAEVLSKLCCCCNWWWWPLAMTTLALRPPVAATGCCLQNLLAFPPIDKTKVYYFTLICCCCCCCCWAEVKSDETNVAMAGDTWPDLRLSSKAVLVRVPEVWWFSVCW